MNNHSVVPGSTLDHCRVALVDDHALFLSGLAGLLKAMGQNIHVDTFSDSLDCVTALRAGTRFDVVITDLTMKRMNGLALMSEVHAHLSRTPVIILSGVESIEVKADVLASGADAFVHKSCDSKDLETTILAAIEARAQPNTVFKSDWGQEAPLSERIGELSKRQTEVLQLLGTGASNKEISVKLKISENTVKTHLKAIFSALGVNRRTASIQKARALGLI